VGKVTIAERRHGAWGRPPESNHPRNSLKPKDRKRRVRPSPGVVSQKTTKREFGEPSRTKRRQSKEKKEKKKKKEGEKENERKEKKRKRGGKRKKVMEERKREKE